MSPVFDVHAAARQAMRDNGFAADFPPSVLAEAAAKQPSTPVGPVQDLRALAWSSIDNDSSRDLDQIEVAEQLQNGVTRVRIGIADVDALVPKGSQVDQFAAANSTSVYTGIATFPMLPEQLSTDRTSLVESGDRPAIVIQMDVGSDGNVVASELYLALVANRAKLAYDSVGAWLEGHGELPAEANAEIQAQLRLQDSVAQTLRQNRAKDGALDFDTIEAQSVSHADNTVDVELVAKTRANRLIEDFMIAANVATAEFLDSRKMPSIRRIVRTPERWARIVELAAKLGETLPNEPSAPALSQFLEKRRAASPDTFADLSLAVVKLIGPGEYALHRPGDADVGHFGLATHDYTHSTAPNRRFADLVTQRLVKAAIAGVPCPYADQDLAAIATHCTEREDAARKVERQVRKVVAAVSMSTRIGSSFDAIVTGVNKNGTFVRLLSPPVEGRVVRGEEGMDVGEKVRVQLLSTDPVKGFIDFAGVA